mmetsp:Transcript_29495/g.60455  ORF Transcript_29495/g.60455 Transcript_29495/m.60455 type:complete len:238 (+) Transcript_29495:3327-4040(+)
MQVAAICNEDRSTTRFVRHEIQVAVVRRHVHVRRWSRRWSSPDHRVVGHIHRHVCGVEPLDTHSRNVVLESSVAEHHRAAQVSANSPTQASSRIFLQRKISPIEDSTFRHPDGTTAYGSVESEKHWQPFLPLRPSATEGAAGDVGHRGRRGSGRTCSGLSTGGCRRGHVHAHRCGEHRVDVLLILRQDANGDMAARVDSNCSTLQTCSVVLPHGFNDFDIAVSCRENGATPGMVVSL